MNQRECEDFLEAILHIGRLMLQFGAEVWRVEDTLLRICKAYKIPKVEVYALTTLIIITVRTEERIASTQSVKVGLISNNLGALEALNGLSRHICSSTPEVGEIKRMTSEAINSKKTGYYNSIGYILAAGAFTVFFGGNCIDGIVAGVIGLIIFFIEKVFKVSDVHKLIYTLIMSIITGALAIFSVRLGIGTNLDKIIIGTVMLFIPALALVNGTKDMFYRDIMTGLFRVIEAVLVATAIASGFGIAIAILGGVL